MHKGGIEGTRKPSWAQVWPSETGREVAKQDTCSVSMVVRAAAAPPLLVAASDRESEQQRCRDTPRCHANGGHTHFAEMREKGTSNWPHTQYTAGYISNFVNRVLCK